MTSTNFRKTFVCFFKDLRRIHCCAAVVFDKLVNNLILVVSFLQILEILGTLFTPFAPPPLDLKQAPHGIERKCCPIL